MAKAGKIDLVVPYQLARRSRALTASSTAVTVATLDGEEKMIEADVLLPFFGLSMTLGPIADWGLALERNQIAIDAVDRRRPACPASSPSAMSSTYPGKLKLILSGFAEAADAARSAFALVHPETCCTSNIRPPRACLAPSMVPVGQYDSAYTRRGAVSLGLGISLQADPRSVFADFDFMRTTNPLGLVLR